MLGRMCGGSEDKWRMGRRFAVKDAMRRRKRTILGMWRMRRKLKTRQRKMFDECHDEGGEEAAKKDVENEADEGDLE